MQTNQSASDDLVTVVPSNTVPIVAGSKTRGLYVGVTGDVTVITGKAQTVKLTAVPAGTLLPIQVTHVKATGTTATDMVGVF